MSDKRIIEIKDLVKSYGKAKAVDGISFTVAEGELFAFLGENGAGKSTTINILCGVLQQDSGSIIFSENESLSSEEVKRSIGVVFQDSVLDKDLTVKDNLMSRAALYGIFGSCADNRIKELSSLLELDGLMSRSVGKLSGGQRRRIDIARALLHSPKLLILDEPTTGLDPQTRKNIWMVLNDLIKNKKMTVFLTTHYMEEAAEADHVVIIDKGRIIARGTPHELKTRYAEDRLTVYGISEDDIKDLGYRYEASSDAVRLYIPDTTHATRLIISKPELFVDYEVEKGKMDDVFLALTGSKMSGGEEK